jgi:hypothetical protein
MADFCMGWLGRVDFCDPDDHIGPVIIARAVESQDPVVIGLREAGALTGIQPLDGCHLAWKSIDGAQAGAAAVGDHMDVALAREVA